MKVLSLGLDNSILDKNSSLAKRVVEYGDLVDKYTVIVPSGNGEKIILSEKVKAYGASQGNKIFKFFKICKLARKILKEEKYNLITVQDQYFLGLLGYRLAKKFKIGLEIQIHGFEKYSGLRKIIAKFIIPKANSIRTVSQRMKKKLVNEFKVAEEKVTVVPIYTKVKGQMLNVTRLPARQESQKDKFIFLTVGRLVEIKNISMQIKAIIETAKENVELWIVGDGEERKKLEAEAKGNESIKFLGWQNNLEKFYEQADAFLLTSNYEGWGIVVVEAAAYGLPIIMTDVGCAGELIKNGESGIIIPVVDQKELEKEMIRLVDDTELREKLGRGAKQAIKKLPTKEETLKLYKKSWEKAVK